MEQTKHTNATQLKIDLSFSNFDEVNAFYKAITALNDNNEFDIAILDDGNAPYTEDITEQYKAMKAMGEL